MASSSSEISDTNITGLKSWLQSSAPLGTLLFTKPQLANDSPAIQHAQQTRGCNRGTLQVFHSNQAGPVIIKIEHIMESILDNVMRGKELVIAFKRRPTRLSNHTDPAHVHDASIALACSSVSFPGKTASETKLFTQILSIIQLSHQALLSGTFVTKRNIFYQHRELFKDQRVVDGLVDDIAYTLGFGRDSLNIVAASVGIVCGEVGFVMKDGSFLNASGRENGLVIPLLKDIERLQLSSCQWVLVIEKEATFRTLAASNYCSTSSAGQGVIVTSKGYPTLATRLFLHSISSIQPDIPIYGLVDFDPHGIRIFRTYKHGSLSMGHERNATVPSMKWLGIKSHDLLQSHTSGQSWSILDDAMTLTESDRKTAAGVLREICNGQNQDAATLQQRREVQVMLMLNIKAEIQAADDYGDITAWLDCQLYEAQENGG